MPCHITRLLAVPALMTVAATGGDALVADDRVVLHAEQQHRDLEVLRVLRRRSARPVQALDHAERADGAELRVELGPRDDEFADPVGGGPVQGVAAAS